MTLDRTSMISPSPSSNPAGSAPWARDPDEILRLLETSKEAGLDESEVIRRRARFGPNQLQEAPRRSSWAILREQFASLIVALLVVASVVAFLSGEKVEALAILGVIVINAAIGFVTELRARRSVDALRRLGSTLARVRRGGVVDSVPAEELVPGDLLVLDAGDILTADVRLVTASRLQVDESPLTGESLPVEKSVDIVAEESALPDRRCMIFKGCAITRGSAEGVVVATGMATELGRVSSLVAVAEPERTPLEKRLDRLGQRLILLTLVITAVVAVAFVVSGRPLYVAVEIAIALAVATIPEGLPIVATIALARGMWRMARRNALVEQLAAVETLGSTTIILSDKTGTLTENRMTLVSLALDGGLVKVEGSGVSKEGLFEREGRRLDPSEHPDLIEALRVAALCNNATLELTEDGPVSSGDPTEVALLVAAYQAGLDRHALLDTTPEIEELAFDPDTKRMATLHQGAGVVVAEVKGAPESILPLCRFLHHRDGTRELDEEGRRHWLERAEQLAARGERVLALARLELERGEEFDFQNLELLGLAGLFDPPRESVREAIGSCQKAGIRVVMVTGDHGATGHTVARAVGLIDDQSESGPRFIDATTLPPLKELSPERQAELLSARVIARASPEQKLELIELHQRANEVVAMTGDGVNDAPALKKADIGVAMGLRGTQVAREAAAMVLQDDELGTIVTAVAQGRAIFANIRKFVIYLLSCNVSEILSIGLASLAQGPLPILPLQILFLNLVTDVFPALALGVCEGSPALMTEPPRDPREAMVTRVHWRRIFVLGGVMALSVLASLAAAVQLLGREGADATTLAFLTLAMAQLWHVFSMRNPASGWLRNEVTTNRWVWAANGLCLALLVLAVHWSPLARVLSLGNPGLDGWAMAFAFSLVPFLVGQLDLLRRAKEDCREKS